MTDVGQLLQMMQIWTSIYHPQTDGLVEYFSQNLKRMQWRVIDMEGRNRDLLPLYVLLAVKEMPQDNMEFIPFKLLFGRQSQSLPNVAKEA